MRETLPIIPVARASGESHVLIATLLVLVMAYGMWRRSDHDASPLPPSAPSTVSAPTARLAGGHSVVNWRPRSSPRTPESLSTHPAPAVPNLSPPPLPDCPPRPYPYGWFGAEPRTQHEWRPDVYNRYQRQLWK